MTDSDRPPTLTPGGINPTRVVRLEMPPGGYKRPKKPFVIGALVIAVIVGLVWAIQVFVFTPTKVGGDYSAAENALGDTHRVADLREELLTESGSKPCPGSPTVSVTAAEAAAFVNSSAPELLAELNAQRYDTGVRGCFIDPAGVKIETQIVRVGSPGGARTVQQREFTASIQGEDISTNRGNVVITGRETRTGPLVNFVYGYRGVLIVTMKASPVTAAVIDPVAIGAFYDKQMDKLKSDEAQ